MEMSIKELKDSIKEMQEVYDDKDTPTDIKDSIAPSLKRAKEMLVELSSAEKEKQDAEAAETKAISKAKPKLKASASVEERRSAQKDIVKKTVAKKEAVKKVATVKSKIEKELPGLMAFVAKTKSLKGYRGKSEDELQADAKKKAMKPGKRISAKGNRYYEHRANRSDVMPNKYPHLEEGGSIPDDYSINVFGYHTKYFYPEIGGEFANAIEILNAHKDREGFYFRNTSEALERMARAMDHVYMTIELSKVQPVTKEEFSNAIDQALLAAVFNYKSGLNIRPQYIRDAILTLSSDGIKYEAGGEIGNDEIRGYVNEKIRAAGLDVDEFWEKIDRLKLEPKDSKDRVSLVHEIDDMINEADIPEIVFVDSAGIVSEIPYYEPGEEDSDEFDGEIYIRQVLLGSDYDHGAYGHYGSGGRLKSAINRDRAYESDQKWELDYKRKTRPKHPRYQKFAAGGAMPDLIDDFPKGTKVYVDGDQFENSWPKIKDDQLRKKLIKTILPYLYEIGIVQSNTKHSATVKYGTKTILIPKVFLNRFTTFSADRIKELKLVVQDFIPVLRDFNERFMSDKPEKIKSVIKDLKKAMQNDDTLYLEAGRAYYNLTRFHDVNDINDESWDIYDALTEDFYHDLIDWAGADYPEAAEWYLRSYNISPEYVGSGKKANETIKSLKGYTKNKSRKKKLFGGIVTVRTPDNLFNAHSGDGSIDI